MGQDSIADDRRRDSVFLLAKIAGADGDSRSHRARNLSSEGVCIEQPDELMPGTKLILSIGLVERIHAEVMWARGGFAGLRFAAPIDLALARKRAPRSLDPKVGWGRANGL